MKKRASLFIIFLFSAQLLYSQTWSQKTDLPGYSRYGAIGFSVNGKGYIGLGDNGFFLLNDLWEYNPVINSWKQKSNIPGLPRRVGISFSVNSMAFVGLGWTGVYSLHDFYQYDSKNNAWIKLPDYPGIGGRNCFAASVSGKGYVGGGSVGVGTPYASDLWEFNPLTNQWKYENTLPFGGRIGGITAGIDGALYLGLGHNNVSDFNDFWVYFPASNVWKKLTDFPGKGRLQASCFVLNDKIIVGGGFRLGKPNSQLSDYFEYDPKTDNWTPIISFANGSRSVSVGFSVGEFGYLSTGFDASRIESKDLWEYGEKKKTIDTIPEFHFNLFPNPNVGNLIFEYQTPLGPATFNLFDNLGQLILSREFQDLKSKETIDISKLANATYYYVFRTPNNNITGKFSKVD